jgi:hypothetical protein
MKNYIVYSRGILRYEGSADDNCDYTMLDGRPTFYSRLNAGDKVTVFVYVQLEPSHSVPQYITNKQLLAERRDYDCLDTPAGSPMRAKNRVVTRF